MDHTIIYGNIRVQLLSADIVRIEYSEKQDFCDRDTFFDSRLRCPVPPAWPNSFRVSLREFPLTLHCR